jgi:hypothetical protein
MSIYATLWKLKFPEYGDDYLGCDWIEVTAQGVPPHIGSTTPGCGYEDGDPYAGFMPPPVNGDGKILRAVVFIKEGTRKGTPRNPQEYVDPLLSMTGEEYDKIDFKSLHSRICDSLRGSRPKLVMEILGSPGEHRLVYEDGTSKKRRTK